jgi:uncharacterized membrane protein YphA (DoxX/SURF4 family)
MQRLFSMFPRGLPGLALLLLRASVVIALLDENCRLWGELPLWVLGAAVLISIALAIGFLTPIFAAVALVFHALLWGTLGIDSSVVALVVALDAVTLALLGPGAYSIDSYRFGHRVIVLPPA